MMNVTRARLLLGLLVSVCAQPIHAVSFSFSYLFEANADRSSSLLITGNFTGEYVSPGQVSVSSIDSLRFGGVSAGTSLLANTYDPDMAWVPGGTVSLDDPFLNNFMFSNDVYDAYFWMLNDSGAVAQFGDFWGQDTPLSPTSWNISESPTGPSVPEGGSTIGLFALTLLCLWRLKRHTAR